MTKKQTPKKKTKNKPVKQPEKPVKQKKERDEFSNAIKLLVVVGIAAFILSYSIHYISSQKEKDELYELMNKRCLVLQDELLQIYGNYTICMELYEDEGKCNLTYNINCYYAQCPTNEQLMEKTQPLCVCDFSTEQGEATFCIRTV